MLHSCTDQVMTNTLADMELTAAQGHIIAFVAHHGPPPCARDIEQAFQLSHPTVSGLLTRLERKDFIEQRPDPSDRRCKRIFLLEKGRQCLSVMDQTIRQTEHRIVQNFTPQEQELFSQLLNRAIENMGGNLPHPKFEEE